MAVPASPLRRATAATGSLLLMATLIGGLPVALVVFAGNPLPASRPTADGIWSALTSVDDGSLFLGLLAMIGWLAWAGFTASVALEVLRQLTRLRVPSIPGMQRFATLLVTAVATVATSPTLTSTSAALVDSPPVAAVAAPIGDQPAEAAGGPGVGVGVGVGFGSAPSALHLVERGEGLLDVAERYGVPWQRIAEANYGAEQPDGRTLERGQTRIYPGWQLRIPATASGPVQAGFGAAPSAAPVQAGFGSAPQSPAGGTGEVVRSPDPESDAEPAPAAHEVAQGDWMWHIADRYLGDPERYPEIADLNPQYADRHGNYPDHIEPGWALQLPEDAVDSGTKQHATGSPVPAGQEGTPEADEPEGEEPEGEEPESEEPEGEEPEDTGDAEDAGDASGEGDMAGPAVPAEPVDPVPPADPVEPVEPVEPVPPAAAGFGSAPELAPAPDLGAGQVDELAGGSDQHLEQLERLAPGALASAGLLSALVLGAVTYHRRRRHQHHLAGQRFGSPAGQRLERVLRSAQQPLDTARLDAALRHLGVVLAGRPQLPDVAGAMVDQGTVDLLLAVPCPDPPPPWQDHGDRWSLPAGTALPPLVGPRRLAPLPTLAAVGSQAGTHLLLDLERLGVLAIHGDPGRGMDLLRYLAAELACNTWSDAAEVLVAGFHPQETELLVTLSPRIRPLPSIADALAVLRQRAASARATLGHTGAPDALTGRVRGVAGDAWLPQVLLAAAPTTADLTALATLEEELAGTRCAVAVATTDPNPARHRAWRVTVTPDGVMHVRMPFLRASLCAAALTTEELVPLAEAVRTARTEPPGPVPLAAEIEPWAAGTDAAGVPAMTIPAGAQAVPAVPADPDLAADLRAWHAGGAGRPRIGVLGPVIVDAAGPVPETRRRLHTELVVFLSQRGARGADATMLDAALWPDITVAEPSRQLALGRVRRWLGSGPDGTPWLPDVDADLAYRLAEGYLFDWHLFRRLRTRGAGLGPAGAGDLRAALELVRGVPLDGADRARGPGTRNPYPWLAGSDLHPDHLVATIVDTAHELAELCLGAGDPDGARWAVQRAWLADRARDYDQPWRDLLRAEQADGRTGQLRAVLAELMEARDAEAPEDLAPETYQLVSAWPPHVLVPAG